MLNAQIKAKADTVLAGAMGDIRSVCRYLSGIVSQQADILTRGDRLGKSSLFEPQLADIQKAIQILATGELPKALIQPAPCNSRKTRPSSKDAKQLKGTQQRVIDVLQTLLGLIPQVVDGKIVQPMSSLRHGQLPPVHSTS